MRFRPGWLAWSLWGVAILLLPGIVVQTALGWVGPTDLPFAVGFAALQLGAATTGAIISSRLPGNAVGWIFLAMGVTMGLLFAAGSYSEIGFNETGDPLPGAGLAAWVGAWIFIPAAFGLPMFLLLLFPNGRFLTRRWRIVGWMLGSLVTFAAVSKAFTPGRIHPGIENPLAPGGALGEMLMILGPLTDFLALPGFVLAVAGLVVRLWRSRGIERQQLKWFTYMAAFASVGLGLAVLIPGGIVADLAFLVGLLALAGLPVAAGMAILRYRLYDIDLLINRTLVYTALTVTLVLVYVGGVASTQAAFRILTGQDQQPQLAVVASTLVIAAMFVPLRRGLQRFVDRRFYRQKYDGRLVLEAFSKRLRDETELEVLSGDLISVVRETVHPTRVSLWLREGR